MQVHNKRMECMYRDQTNCSSKEKSCVYFQKYYFKCKLYFCKPKLKQNSAPTAPVKVVSSIYTYTCSIFKLKQTFPLKSYLRFFMYQYKSNMKKDVPLLKWKKCTLFTLRRFCPFLKNCISNLKRIYKIVFLKKV